MLPSQPVSSLKPISYQLHSSCITMVRSRYYKSPSKKSRNIRRLVSLLKGKLNSVLCAKPALSVSPTQFTEILPKAPVLTTSKIMSISIPSFSNTPTGGSSSIQPPGAQPPWPAPNRTSPSRPSPQPFVPSTTESTPDLAERERQRNVQNTLDMIDEALRRLNCN